MSSPQVDLNTQITLSKRPTADYPAKEDVFQITYVPPVPTDRVEKGEVVVRNLFISIDATNRVWISGVKSYMPPINPGDLMKGLGVAEVIFSNSSKFKVGDRVLGVTYWQKYSLLNEKTLTLLPSAHPQLENFLGVLGVAGLTAYFGLQKIGKLKAGEKVVVSAAAGSVGEIAVQLAKLAGCEVCGIAGSADKCAYVKSLGADHVIDYKKEALKQRLGECFPKGVDVYFDNVGGEMLDEVLMHIREQGRVIACGAISTYSSFNQQRQEPYRIKNYPRIIIKRAIIQGFLYFDYAQEFPQAIRHLSQLVEQRKLKYSNDIRNGVEECPRGLKDLLEGRNTGKVIIKVSEPTPAASL
jgi:NADPH-dependent curcumin reductase CurA